MDGENRSLSSNSSSSNGSSNSSSKPADGMHTIGRDELQMVTMEMGPLTFKIP